MKHEISIWIAIQPDNKPYMFVDEPIKENGKWVGNYYVNSILYTQIVALVKQTDMTVDSDPQPITFTLK